MTAANPAIDDDHRPDGDGPVGPAANRKRKWWLLLVVVLVSAGVDQATKRWAVGALAKKPRRQLVVVKGAIALRYVENRGAAWGFLQDASPGFRKPFFMAVSVLAMGFILVLYRRLQPGQRSLPMALALIMSGAVGNFIDRIYLSYVIDFIDCTIFGYHWPTFNVADVAISLGVALLFVDMVRQWRQDRTVRRGQESNAEPSDVA